MSKNCYICGVGSEICQDCNSKYVVSSSPQIIHGTDTVVKIWSLDKVAVEDPEDPYGVDAAEKEEEKIKEVEAQGFEVIRGQGDELLLDIDNSDTVDWTLFYTCVDMIHAKYGIKKMVNWNSKSGYPHTHVMVFLKESVLTNIRIGLEMALGSDPKRGILNYKKMANKNYYPSLLFRPPNVDINESFPSDFRSWRRTNCRTVR